MSHDYTDEYNYNNYPELREKGLFSGDLDHGHDGTVAIKHPDHLSDGKPNARFNRAHMNVDQYNYLAGKVNSIAKVRPYTFNDYYELYPYTSGEFIVPTGLYSVEFRIDATTEEDFQCLADTYAEAKGRLLKTSVAFPAWSSKSFYLSESGGILTNEDEIIYWQRRNRADEGTYKESDGAGGEIEKDYVYNFLVMSHSTGWSIKRNNYGYEEWEDEKWLSTSMDAPFSPYEEGYYNPLPAEAAIAAGVVGDPRTYDGSKVIGLARRLGIPIKTHNDFPDDYITEMEKHDTDLPIKTNVYTVQVEKAQFPLYNGSDSLPPDEAFGSWYRKEHYKIRSSMGYVKTDFGSTRLEKFGDPPDSLSRGYATAQPFFDTGLCEAGLTCPQADEISPKTNMEIFLSHTTEFTLDSQLTTSRDVRMYDAYKQSGIHWDDTDHKPPGNSIFIYGDCPKCSTDGGTDSTAKKIAKHQGYPTCTQYMFFDRMPDFFMNHHSRLSWGEGTTHNLADGEAAYPGELQTFPANLMNEYVWGEQFYSNNDHYIERGFGVWADVSPEIWERSWPGANYSYVSHENMLTGCQDLRNPFGGLLEACQGDNHDSASPWKNILAGFSVGYREGEVYRRSILRGRHLVINKPQDARWSNHNYQDSMEMWGSEAKARFAEMQEHTETYDLLPYPAKKNTSYGIANPTGGGNVDPNYLNDPFDKIVSTDWISVEDVKAKAEELGFLFEFRRLSVPFKLQQFDFNVGDAKAFARRSGIMNYQYPSGPGVCGEDCQAGGPYQQLYTGHPSILTTHGNGGLDNQYYAYEQGPAPRKSKAQSPIFSISDNPPDALLWQQAPIPDDAARTLRSPWPLVVGDSADTAFASMNGHINNIRNGVYWDNYTTTNLIYWIGGSNTSHGDGDGLSTEDEGGAGDTIWPTGAKFWCNLNEPGIASCVDCIDYHNVFGGDAHQGGGCPDLKHPPLYPDHIEDLGDCFECTEAEKDDGTCIECNMFKEEDGGSVLGKIIGEDPEPYEDDYKFLKLEGAHNDGIFDFKATGYTPFIDSLKTFVWAENAGETEWVKPVGLTTRYVYRYRTDDFYELYKTDSVKEQFIHPNSSDPYRVETVSSWLGNYIYALGDNAKPYEGHNTIIDPISGSSYGLWGAGFVNVDTVGGSMPNVQVIVNRAKRSVYPWGTNDGYDVDHYKMVWHLGLLNYSVQPLLPITISSDSVAYKNWMLNIQERLYPKYYLFQDASSPGLNSGHASFAYIEPDVYFGDMKVDNFLAEHGATSTGQFIVESGMMINSLDLFDGMHGTEQDEHWIGIRTHTMDRVGRGGETKSPLPWLGEGASNAQKFHVFKDNSVPSLYTDFMPKTVQHVSGGCWGKITNEHFFDYQGTLAGYSPPRGTKIALQFYINNTIDRSAGESREAGPETLTCWQH